MAMNLWQYMPTPRIHRPSRTRDGCMGWHRQLLMKHAFTLPHHPQIKTYPLFLPLNPHSTYPGLRLSRNSHHISLWRLCSWHAVSWDSYWSTQIWLWTKNVMIMVMQAKEVKESTLSTNTIRKRFSDRIDIFLNNSYFHNSCSIFFPNDFNAWYRALLRLNLGCDRIFNIVVACTYPISSKTISTVADLATTMFMELTTAVVLLYFAVLSSLSLIM